MSEKFDAFKVNEQFNQCFEKFNWEKVHKVMTLLDWTWFIYGGGVRVPNIGELQDNAKRLFITLKEDLIKGNLVEGESVSSGGFWVSYQYGEIHLKFVVEEQQSH